MPHLPASPASISRGPQGPQLPQAIGPALCTPSPECLAAPGAPCPTSLESYLQEAEMAQRQLVLELEPGSLPTSPLHRVWLRTGTPHGKKTHHCIVLVAGTGGRERPLRPVLSRWCQ